MTLLNLQEWVLGTLGTVLEKRFFELLGVLFRFSRKKGQAWKWASTGL